MYVDDALNQLGAYGRFQMTAFVLVALYQLICAWHWANPFLGADPPHRCHVTTPIPESIPIIKNIEGDWIYHPCKQFNLNSTKAELRNSQCIPWLNQTAGCAKPKVPCQGGWVYDPSYKRTLVNEWDLVCTESVRADLLTSSIYMGDFVGALFLPWLADVFGRRPIFVGSTLAFIPFAVFAAFCNTPLCFAANKFITGVFMAGAYCVSSILVCEYFPSEHRAFPSQAIWMFGAAGLMSLSVLAYFFRDWRVLESIISWPALPLALLYLIFVPESLHYLIAKNKLKQAQQWLERAAKVNNKPVPDLIPENVVPAITAKTRRDSSKQLSTYQSKQASLSFCNFLVLDILRTRNLKGQSALLCLAFMVNALVYYGTTLSSTSLSGDRYINFFLVAAVEIPAYAISILMLTRFGRIRPTVFFHLLAAAALLTPIFFPKGHGWAIARTGLYIAGKMSITASFGSLYLLASEIFPTDVRNAGIGLCAVFARAGETMAPFTVSLSRVSYFYQPVLYGTAAFIAAILVSALPETKDRPLPEHIEDVKGSWGRKATITPPQQTSPSPPPARKPRDSKLEAGDEKEKAPLRPSSETK